MAPLGRPHPIRVAPPGHTAAMARRFDPTRVLVAQVLGAVEHGDAPAELVEVAQGRRDVLEAALATSRRGSAMRAPIGQHAERLRAALELVT